MVLEKSGGTIEEISITAKNPQWVDGPSLLKALSKCKATTREVTFLGFDRFMNSQLFESISLWPILSVLILSETLSELPMPRPRLLYKKSHVHPSFSQSPSTRIKILWLESHTGHKLDRYVHNDLVSFAEIQPLDPHAWRSFIGNSSETLVHLHLQLKSSHIGKSRLKPLLLPHLRVLGGSFEDGPSAYFECPHLETVIYDDAWYSKLKPIPPTVKQIWLPSLQEETWSLVLASCPSLEVLKIRKNFKRGSSKLGFILQGLQNRNKMIANEESIGGVKVQRFRLLMIPASTSVVKYLRWLSSHVQGVTIEGDYSRNLELEC